MEEEDYEEVYDLKKLGIVIIVIIGIGVGSVYFLAGDEITIPEITLPEIQQEQTPIVLPQVENPGQNIKDSYKKFLDFGITEDDIYNIQEISCDVFYNANQSFSTEPKYEMIFEQRRSEC